jgi:hypothetical protein
VDQSNHSSQIVAACWITLKLFFAAFVLFAALESTSRLSLFGLAGLDPRRVPFTRGLTPPGLWTSTAQDYRYVPHLDVFANLVRLKTNSQGFRDKEYSLERSRDTFRVAVVGSSFTVPSGVEIEHAFHSVLEERFSEEHAPTTYEFINFATIIMGPKQVLGRLRKHALAYDPDLILVSATRAVVPYYLIEPSGSPAGRSRDKQWPPPGLVKLGKSKKGMGFRSYLLTRWNQKTARMKQPQRPMEPPPTGPKPNDIVKKFGDISRKTGIPIVIVRLEYDPDAIHPGEDRLAARVVDEGMYYVNTRDAFRGTTPRDFWVHSLDSHPNARAHAIFADVLGEFLSRQDLLGR